MSVVVRLHGYLKDMVGVETLEVQPGQTVSQLQAALMVSRELALIPVVNQQIVEADYVLQNGDRFELIPPIDGGAT